MISWAQFVWLYSFVLVGLVAVDLIAIAVSDPKFAFLPLAAIPLSMGIGALVSHVDGILEVGA